MMEPQIYLWSGERELLLARHDFYMEQTKARVLGNFNNMEEEANRFSEEVYERIGSMPSYGDGDMSVAAEAAFEHGADFYMMLSDLKTQTTLGALASLFHQWDKDFRDFMERQLAHSFDRAEVERNCWQPNIGKLFDVLEEWGWPLRQAPWFPLVSACRLIVNVHKHGKGRSLDELAQDYPQYFKGPFDNLGAGSWLKAPDHENLSVSEAEFDQIADALRQFWADFPERLFMPNP
ncbi:MAG: hypothetical protein R8L07_08420 [Alphaproteobacteria bacterium]|nr:hypothetical protein [Alphaproteobacteria bacterium]